MSHAPSTSTRSARLEKEREKLTKFITGHEKKLANEGFVNNAPEHVIADVKETLANLQSQLESVNESLQSLSDE